MTHGNLRTLHTMQRQRYKNSMPKTPKNQGPAYAEPYHKVMAVGYRCIPHHSQRTMYNRGYNMYDTYYKVPTRQTTCHEASRDKFKTWKKTFVLLSNSHLPSPIHLCCLMRPPTPSPQHAAAHRVQCTCGNGKIGGH